MSEVTAATPWIIGGTVGYVYAMKQTYFWGKQCKRTHMYMYLQLVKVSASSVPHLVCLVPLPHEFACKFALGPSGRSSTACLTNFKLGLAED